MNDITYIGLDVHKTTVCVAIAESGRGGEVREVGVFENRPDDHLAAWSPPCRVVRASIAELRPLVFCATCGVTVIERSSLTKSSAS